MKNYARGGEGRSSWSLTNIFEKIFLNIKLKFYFYNHYRTLIY